MMIGLFMLKRAKAFEQFYIPTPAGRTLTAPCWGSKIPPEAVLSRDPAVILGTMSTMLQALRTQRDRRASAQASMQDVLPPLRDVYRELNGLDKGLSIGALDSADGCIDPRMSVISKRIMTARSPARAATGIIQRSTP